MSKALRVLLELDLKALKVFKVSLELHLVKALKAFKVSKALKVSQELDLKALKAFKVL